MSYKYKVPVSCCHLVPKISLVAGPCHSTFDDVKGGTYTITARSLRHMNILQAAAYLKTLNNKQLERCGVCVAERR